MARENQKAEKNSSLQHLKRKKIWQLKANYHCPVIGTCLSRMDLKRIKHKKAYGLTKSDSDYTAHSALVSFASTNNQKSKTLHKFFDTKYLSAIKRYATITDEDSILAQWQEDCKAGRVSGSFWAVLTHPVSQDELCAQVYRDCHMLSFDTFWQMTENNKAAKTQQQRVSVVLQDKQRLSQKIKWQKEKILELTAKHQEVESINRGLSEENALLKAEISDLLNNLKSNTSYKQLGALTAENRVLKDKIVVLEQKLSKINVQLTENIEDNHLIQNSYGDLEKKYRELKQRNLPMQQMMDFYVSNQQDAVGNCNCNTCENYDTGKCSGPDLCGKTVLYVGGRSSMVPRYRDYIEKCGGNFLHHDGGKENSRQLLPSMLTGADVVLCPVDCVSHDACKCAKKVCKRYQKPFVTLRTSGLSAMTKSLEMIQK